MPRDLDSQLCLVGNIKDEAEIKHFKPGAKVYCFPALWGDGYEKIMVIGHHRASNKFAAVVIDSKWITSWRAKAVYSPEVLRLLRDTNAPDSETKVKAWKSKDQIEAYLAALKARPQ